MSHSPAKETVIPAIFIAGLIVCIVTGHSVIYAMLPGYCLFFIYGLTKKFSFMDVLKMSWNGIKKVKNILITFILIGMITAVWRECGTIPFVIYYSSAIIVPSVFILVAFLLCCLISALTGTSVGSAATLGIICMTVSNAIGINPVFTGGAVLSGVYFGDRCSVMSTSALLVSELTDTDIYVNVKNMVKTSIVPFLVSCILYLILGINQSGRAVTAGIWDIFKNNFNLELVVILPALIIIVFSAIRIKVRTAMIVSILAACVISILVQHRSFYELIKTLLMGFATKDEQLAAMMNGGGIISMLTVIIIVCLSSCYSGIFEGTGLLNGLKSGIDRMNSKIGVYGGLLVSSVLANMIACSQTLGIMLVHFFYKDTHDNKEKLAVNFENTVVVIAPLVPWSIASAVPLAASGAPVQSILTAFYLFLLPLWNITAQKKRNIPHSVF